MSLFRNVEAYITILVIKMCSRVLHSFFVDFGKNYAVDLTILRLFITSIEPDPVPITIETLKGFTFTGIVHVTQNETTTVEIPNAFLVFSSSKRVKGIRVSAGDKRIVVYRLKHHDLRSDAFSALPCVRLPVQQYVLCNLIYRWWF